MEISIPSLLRIKPNALYKIGKYLRKESFFKVALFYGEGIKEMIGEHVSISMDSSEVVISHEEIVTDNNIENVFKSTIALPKSVQAIVALGGGKAIDYAKYVAFVAQIPIITVPTAISNDGFSSPGASLVVEGKRKSLKAKIPYGVIMDTNIIKASPKHFTISGIGDLLSKITAIYDWKLSYRNTGEYVNDFAVLISNTSVENLVNYTNKNIEDVEFLRIVSGALVMSGVAMEVSGSSRPSSGSEHLISHAYDKIAAKPSLHGIQVGVATYACAWLQNNPKLGLIKGVLEQTGFFDYVKEHPLSKEDFIKSIREAPSIKEDYYTILSEKGNIEKLVNFVENDEYINNFLR